MTSIFKKVLKGGGEKRSHSPPPVNPPSPDLSHLTAEELAILSGVLKRQEQFEEHEKERIRRMEEEVVAAEQAVTSSQPERSKKWRLSSARLCRLCMKSRMSDGSARMCSDCRKRVCGRCGSYCHAKTNSKKAVWLCRLCLMKREISYRTGGWYHGARGYSFSEDGQLGSTAADALRRKLKDANAESTSSEHQTSCDNPGESDGSPNPLHLVQPTSNIVAPSSGDPKHPPRSHRDDPAPRPAPRHRNLPMGGAPLPLPPPAHRRHADDRDDDDENIQDILLERRLSYRRRQQKRMKKRSVYNGKSVGGGGGAGCGGGGGGGGGAESVLHRGEDGDKVSASKGQRPSLETVMTIPLRSSLEDFSDECQGVQSAHVSPTSPERPASFCISHSVDREYFRSHSETVRGTSRSDFFRKTASTRRKVFQRAAAASGRNLAITLQRSSFSDSEKQPPNSTGPSFPSSSSHSHPHNPHPHPAGSCPYPHHSGCDDPRSLSPCDGRGSPRRVLQDRVSSPDDRRQGSSRDHQHSSQERIANYSSSSPTKSQSRGKRNPQKMNKSRSVSPGNKRNSSGSVSPASSRKNSHNKPDSQASCLCDIDSSEPCSPTVTGWKAQQGRRSLSPSDVSKAQNGELPRRSNAPAGKEQSLYSTPVSPTHRKDSSQAFRTSPQENPHKRSPSPSAVRRMRDADGRRVKNAGGSSPSDGRRVRDAGDSSPSFQKKSPERRRVVEGKEQGTPFSPTQPPRRRGVSMDTPKSRYKIDRSYSEGSDRGEDKGDTGSGGGYSPKISRSRNCDPQVNINPNVSPSGSPSSQRKAQDPRRQQRRPSPSSPSSSASYSCATQALRQVRSREGDVTQTESHDAITCRCSTWERRKSGSPSSQSGREGERSASPAPGYLKVQGQGQGVWGDSYVESQLVHTVLHKPPNSYPESFGVHVTGGVCDVNGGLLALIRDVTPGSPAQLAGLQAGDQVVEWNGQPLSSASFERVLTVVSGTNPDILHLFTLPRALVGRTTSPHRCCSSRQSDADHRSSNPPSPTLSASDSNVSSSGYKRRMLPRTPVEIGRESRQMFGEVLLCIDYDPTKAILYVTIVMARDLALPQPRPGNDRRASDRSESDQKSDHKTHFQPMPAQGAEPTAEAGKGSTNPRLEPPHVMVHRAEPSSSGVEGAEYDDKFADIPCPFILVHLLPDRKSRECHKTEPRRHNRKPEWEQTFVYDNFTITELVARSLELTVWSRGDAGRDEFLGEILIELREWRFFNHNRWCRLYDHDDNSPPLAHPHQLPTNDSVVSSASSSCYDDLTRSSDNRESGSITSGQTDTIGNMLCRVTRGMVKNRLVSRVSSSFSHADRKGDPGSDESSTGDVSRRRSASETHLLGQPQEERLPSPNIQRRTSFSYNMDLLAPPRPLSRANSTSSFFLSDDSSDGDPYSPLPVTPDRPAPDGDDITSILGPGQVPPRPSNETKVCGDIKLGFAVSKGQLEVDVICVRGLQRQVKLHPPDTYVKTYLVEGPKTIQKKKSQVIKASTDPIFRRKIKYSACNVHGRHMRIVVWEKPRNFERKQSLGETVVRLDTLDLSAHTMTWYKLFPVNSTDLGSTDSLSQW